jgi:hypothetical protein
MNAPLFQVFRGSFAVLLVTATALNSRAQEADDDSSSPLTGILSNALATASSRIALAGTVLDPDGKPAEKAKASLFPSSWQGEKTTDSLGRFALLIDPSQPNGAPPAQHFIVARDLVRNLATFLALDGDTTNASLKLEPALVLAGRVTDTAGKPIAGAQAQCLLQIARVSSAIGATVRSDADGRFEIKALPPGQSYVVTVSARGFGRYHNEVEPITGATQRVELAAFQLLAADQRIAGIVLDAENTPVDRASIYIQGEQQPGSLNVMTGPDGRFSVSKVCTAPMRLTVNSQRSGFATADVEGGDTNITIQLSSSTIVTRQSPRSATLKGRPLPDLAALGLTPADIPSDQPLLVLLIDTEQRPSRRALKLLTDRAADPKERPVPIVVIQAGGMTEDAFAAWKKETTLPFVTAFLKGDPEKARATWGSSELPWLILADKTHRVAADGFPPEDLDAKLEALAPGK